MNKDYRGTMRTNSWSTPVPGDADWFREKAKKEEKDMDIVSRVRRHVGVKNKFFKGVARALRARRELSASALQSPFLRLL